jgi:hypothetical protein
MAETKSPNVHLEAMETSEDAIPRTATPKNTEKASVAMSEYEERLLENSR